MQRCESPLKHLPQQTDVYVQQNKHPHNQNTMHHILISKCHILKICPHCYEEGQIHTSGLQKIIKIFQISNAHNMTLRLTVGEDVPYFMQRLPMASASLFKVYLLSMVDFHRVLFKVFTLFHYFSGHFLGLMI